MDFFVDIFSNLKRIAEEMAADVGMKPIEPFLAYVTSARFNWLTELNYIDADGIPTNAAHRRAGEDEDEEDGLTESERISDGFRRLSMDGTAQDNWGDDE